MASAIQAGNGAEAYVEPIKEYARIQEFGGTIKPIRGKYLTFQIDGQWRRVKEVTLPARPYLGPAVTEHVSDIVQAMAEEVERGIQQSV
jgi:phage gpG-like protein